MHHHKYFVHPLYFKFGRFIFSSRTSIINSRTPVCLIKFSIFKFFFTHLHISVYAPLLLILDFVYLFASCTPQCNNPTPLTLCTCIFTKHTPHSFIFFLDIMCLLYVMHPAFTLCIPRFSLCTIFLRLLSKFHISIMSFSKIVKIF